MYGFCCGLTGKALYDREKNETYINMDEPCLPLLNMRSLVRRFSAYGKCDVPSSRSQWDQAKAGVNRITKSMDLILSWKGCTIMPVKMQPYLSLEWQEWRCPWRHLSLEADWVMGCICDTDTALTRVIWLLAWLLKFSMRSWPAIFLKMCQD